MTPEAELLLCCARTRLDSETAERIRALLREDMDWAYLLRMALVHGMMPLLYWHLNATCPDAIPQATLAYLRDRFDHNTRRNLFLTEELLNLLNLFKRHGILAMPYKGPVLAASIYGSLALREFRDLDILVQKQAVHKAKDLLLSQGYRLDYRLNHRQEAACMRFQHQLPFSHHDGPSIVELHSDITPGYFAFPHNLKRLWERLEPMSLGGQVVPTLSPEDLLLVLCVHGAKHLWERLGWICDIAEIIRVHQGIDWKRVIEQARALGSERMLFLGLFLARALLGAALPEQVAQRVHADPAVASLAAEARERLFRDTDGPPGGLESCLFHLKVRERVRDGVRFCLGVAMIPTVAEWMRLPLPPSLFPLYFLFRPIRLIGKYGSRLLRRPVQSDLAPFRPTPMNVVERMLALAEVGPTDVVYDLGCGDGRVVILAAKRYGARGVGVDIDPRRIAEAKANARREGMQNLVTFMQQDARTVSLSQATVVTLLLTTPGNLKLRSMLQTQLRPGARIVSRAFGMLDWAPDKTDIIERADGATETLRLWRIEKAPSPSIHSRLPLIQGVIARERSD